MPSPAYIQVEGEQQGLITSGANTQESMGQGTFKSDWADYSTIIAFEHKITLPVDPRNGQPSGSRLHKPFIIHKEFDKASPLLYKALCTGERLTINVSWMRTIDGKETEYFTHKLTEALLVDMEAIMPLATEFLGKDNQGNDVLKNAKRKHEERWFFSYRKIEWEHTEASTSASDDWQEG